MRRIAALLAFLAIPALAWADTTVTSHKVTPQASSALESNHVVSSVPGVLYGARITTAGTSGFFMILNLAADAGGGGAAVAPVWCAQVAANSSVWATPDTNTVWTFDKGIVLVFSTTGCLTETDASNTAFFSWSADQQ